MSSSKDDAVELLGPSESRQWTWVFRALWSSAPRDSSKIGQWKQGDTNGDYSISTQTHNSSLSSSSSRIATPSCHLRLQIPDTILFESGEPRKWVGVSREGIVVRKSFLPSTASSGTENDLANQTRAAASSEIRRRPLTPRRVTCRQQQSSSSRAILDELEILQRLDAVRMAFVASVARGSAPTEEELDAPPVCVARYNDGSAELLSEKSLKKLGGFHNWRVSLSGLQAYVRPGQTATGAYDRSSKKSSRDNNNRKRKSNKDHVTASNQIRQATHESDRTSAGSRRRTSSTATSSIEHACHGGEELKSRLPSNNTPPDTGETPMDNEEIATRQGLLSTFTLDVATTDVAWVVEMSYAWAKNLRPHRLEKTVTTARNGDSTVGGPESLGDSSKSRQVLLCGAGRGGRPPWPKSRVRISKLEAEFIIDRTGCAWFSHATRVMVQTVTKEPKVMENVERQCAKRKRLREEAAVAASVAARELRALVTLACRRGLNAEEVFCHFDVEGCGRAGKEQVVKGMATLGISLSVEGAAILVEWVIAASSDTADDPSSTTTPSSASQQRNLGQMLLEADARETTGDSATRAHSTASQIATKIRDKVAQKNNRAGLTPTPLLRRRQQFTADDLWKFAITKPEETVASSKAEDSQKPKGYDNDNNDDEIFAQGRGSARIVGPDGRRLSGGDEKPTMEKSTLAKRRRTGGDLTSNRSGLGLTESHRNGNQAFTGCTGKKGSASSTEKLSSNTRSRRWRQQQKQGSSSVPLYRDNRRASVTSENQELERLPPGNAQNNPSSMPAPAADDDSSQRNANGLAQNDTVTSPSRSTICSDVIDRNVMGAAGRSSGLHRGEPEKLHSSVGVSERTNKGSAQGAKVVRSVDCDNPEVLASFPCENPLEEAAFGKDRVFHVERCVLLYCAAFNVEVSLVL